MAHKLAFIGFGGVGQGLAEIIKNKGTWLSEEFGTDFQIVSIADLYKGALHHPDGLDIEKVLESVQTDGTLQHYPEEEGLIRGWDSFTTIEKSNADTMIEITFTDIKTGQPAIDHCKKAFQSGKNAVLTNKGPVALAYDELQQLADHHGVRFLFEGTVMSGTPALRLPLVSLSGNEIQEIRGILNGTTNYILTKMESGVAFEEALKEAQDKGYAEADPTSDVEGYDVLYKVVILANLVMKEPVKKEDVACQGIAELTPDDMKRAKEEHCTWKLIGKIKKENGAVKASVGPEKIPNDDPLAGISGSLNAITYDCDLSGPVTLIGAGAGIPETGFALLIDLINLERGIL
ncbi:homoserine dehydrogenase [Alteribacillus persepolensis]|uniref:Homoserine dehydrogenase n=1 Tax=Alteribacillus persepolensis TaxID=568899 RepID=A0A1G7Z9V0_9BACI|nr:homoserine dehydrogenase [Alteribacillus persepolensis]SDH05379.1 homoserine dehydrogenase [Alteribacillus persepolensis]